MFCSLLLVLMILGCAVNQGRETFTLSAAAAARAAEGMPNCSKSYSSVAFTNRDHAEIKVAKEGCQLHLYPCGTCERKDGPGAILIQDDCSQSCQKCGN